MKWLFCLWLSTCTLLYGVWESEFEKALSLSQHEGKTLLLFFSASDSSADSMRMKKEILDHPKFMEALSSHFIFLQIDFPLHHALKEEVAAQNQKLQERFQVKHFPSLLLLDGEENEIVRLEYLPESREDLSKQLLLMVAQDKKLQAAQALLQNGVHLTGTRLTELYKMALAMGQKSRAALFLEQGLQSESNRFFMLRAYEQCMRVGEGQSDKAVALRQNLLKERDEETHYSLAVMEFQELSKGATKGELSKLVAPLKEYLSQYSKALSENVWRTEMLMAQVYMSFDQYQPAYEYAQRAYEKAPQDMKGEIARSLRYIQEQSESLANK